MTQVVPAIFSDADAAREIRHLRRRLAAARRRKLGIAVLTGAATALSLLIGGIATEGLLDWLVALPWVARACITLPAVGGAGYLFWRDVLRPLVRLPGDYEMACEVERGVPVFRTRLIASIQFARAASGKPMHALVRALIRETAALSVGLNFGAVVKTNRLRKACVRLLLIVAAVGAMLWFGRGPAWPILERALLMPVAWPTRTQIAGVQSPDKVALGEDLKIAVQGRGLLPAEGKILARTDSGKTSEYPLERDAPGSASYHAVLQSVQEPLTFRVQLNDATSGPLSVAVLTPPVVASLTCRQVYPAYTNLPSVQRAPSDLSLLAGSTLQLQLIASTDLQSATIHLAGLEKDVPLALDSQNPRAAHGEIAIPAKDLTGFSVHLVDAGGIASHDAAVYPIDILPDHPPTIKIVYPESDSELVTQSAKELIAFDAQDDFGVARVLLHFMVNSGPVQTIEFDPGGPGQRNVARTFEWWMSALKAGLGGTIEYWMEAFDANNVTGPGRAETPHAKLRVVSEEEKRAELASRMNDALGGLGEVSRSQDDLTTNFGTLIFPKSAASPAPTP